MALTGKKYGSIHSKKGSDEAALKAQYDNNKHAELLDFGPEAALMYQMEKMQEELDYLRTEISSNKDKTAFPGLGTSSSTALAGNTTVISSGQASAITANTAKVSLTSLMSGVGTTLSFGNMITTPPPKGGKNPTYSIVMTAVKNKVSKSVTLTLT
jgi:hypothetical protein